MRVTQQKQNSNVENKREGWSDAFKKMAENGEDELLIPDIFEDEDIDEWTFSG